MNWFFDLMITAITAIFLQNIIFCGGYGTSVILKTASNPKYMPWFTITITFFTTFTSMICRALELIPALCNLNLYFRVLLFVLYLIPAVIFKYGLHCSEALLRQLSFTAFNTLVLAIPFLNNRSAHNFAESVGLGIGAGAAFALATWLISAGIRRIGENENIPEMFRGLPALFIYVGLLSLAFLGFAGNSLFV